MGDSIKFTIGGQLGPSYRGTLAQAEVEALRANNAMNTKIHAQRARIAALDKAESKLKPRSAEASAFYIQNAGKKAALQQELQLMELKHNLTASASARKMEAEKVAAARVADAEKVASNRAAMATIVAQEREAAIAEDAILAERVAAQKAADLAMLTNVARGYGANANAGGAHGKAGLTGIIRESTVIAREIAMGRGMGRVAGSVTLLAQYMGLLGKVVKSTASEQVFASAAASKLAQSMAAEAVAAQGTSRFAALSAAALKQEAAATDLATKAQIALATAKVSINPLGWVLISGVVIAGIIAGIAMHMHTLAMRAKNLVDMLDPLKKKFTEQADAMRDNAKEHQEYIDWLKKVGAETETLPEKIDQVIKKMREQAQAEMELARLKGASRVALERMEEAQLIAERDVVTRGVLQARREVEDAKMKADSSESAVQAFDPSNARGAATAAENAGKILDAVQEKFDYAVARNKEQAAAGGYAFNPNDVTGKNKFYGVKVGENELPGISLDEAKAAYNKATNESERLAQIQKELHDTLANDKTTVEEKTKSVERLTKEQQAILDQLGIKQTTGREIAKYSGNRGRIPESEMERAGLFQSSALIRTHDTLTESLKVQRSIEKKIGRGTGGHAPGGVNFG